MTTPPVDNPVDNPRKVQGCCPMGCGETLFLGFNGYVTCAALPCPRPDAVTVILEDRETAHLVRIRKGGWTVQHPLRERVDRSLLDCRFNPNDHRPHDVPSRGLSLWRVMEMDSGWLWEEVPQT